MKTLPIFALLLAAALTVPLYAGPIGTYVFTGSATGTIGSTAFTNAALTVTGSADISTVVVGPGLFYIDFGASALTFTIAGAGTGAFTDVTDVFVNQAVNGGTIGLSSQLGDFAAIKDNDIGSTVFATYDLQSSLGPIGTEATDPDLLGWTSLPTSAGSFTVSNYTSVRFQAAVGPATGAPEPGGLALIVIGLLACAVLPILKVARREA